MLDPKGRVVMLSGASRGIGLALAKALLEKGYSLVSSPDIKDPSLRKTHQTQRPPSTSRATPVMKLASSEAR
jgi:NAD(P)-dependent dehydrogenase (short-subunit alcohol dehydrogenase family)